MLGNKSEQNRKAVIGSAIVAKATVKRNGRINLIVVFQQSTRHEFYWVFQAKSARSARRSWKFMGIRGRDFNTDFKAYTDFQSFVAHYSKINHAEVLSVRVLHVRRMATLLAKTAHETIHADWTPRIDSTDPRDFRKVNRAFERNVKGHAIDWQR
jgi:hypothetical protein